MSAKERKEHDRLLRLWATGKASARQMRRCMELDRKSAAHP
jgi:uncharacterized protein YjiS (DUF1127 family)